MRIAASAGRRGLPCRQPEPEDRDVLVGDDPAVSVSMSTTSLSVRIEAVTPLEQGMTDTQLDGYLAWATFLVDRCAVAFENTLPLTRVRKED